MAKDEVYVKPKIKDERGFHNVAMVLMILLAIYSVLPFFLMLSISLSSEASLSLQGYHFIPKEFSTAAYSYLWAKRMTIGRCYLLTILVTVVGTVSNLVLTSLFAYPLSRQDFKQRNLFAFILFFTMLFNGGLTASYIIWTQIFHIKNTIWALILPTLIMNGFYVILYKNNFATNIHPALIEAAKIDGASEWTIYFKIVLPLSLPILATVGLMVALGYWNDWTNGLYYITEQRLYSLQLLLKSIIDNIRNLASLSVNTGSAAAQMPSISIRMAMAVIGVIPIMALYPFFQKVFVAGISLGGVKE